MKPAFRIEVQAWMAQPQTRKVMDALTAGGNPARFVGGCVRDTILKFPVKDIDIATPENPECVMKLIEQSGLRAIPTGIEHGTITAICDGLPFEITTLRRDVETFGRHARVSFTRDWEEDAARRDLTLNALYCDVDGAVFDPVGGLADLKKGRIRFVGDARKRIDEDLLRLLRFFRCFAYYGFGEIDEEALIACREMASKLGNLSVERVWQEISCLLLAADPAPALKLMIDNKVLSHLLPEAVHSDVLSRLIKFEIAADIEPNYLRRLAAIINCDLNGARSLAARLKLSNIDSKLICDLCDPIVQPDPEAGLKQNRATLYKLGEELFSELTVIGAGYSPDKDWLSLFSLPKISTIPNFSLTGQDVLNLGVSRGPKVGNFLEQVESWWVSGDFKNDREACLEYLRSIVCIPS